MRHPLDGNAIAADAHYDQPEQETQPCDQCDGTGLHIRDEYDKGKRCHVFGGSGDIPVDYEDDRG